VQTLVTEHQVIRKICPERRGEHIAGEFPEGCKSTIQYGEGIAGLAVVLSTYGMVSLERIHEILGAVFNITISPGTISAFIERCAERVQSSVERIKASLKAGAVLHVDETGFRVNGKTRWLHVASTNGLTYMTVEEKRGKEGMDASGILPNYKGIAVHDCWSPYFLFIGMLHALCQAHILRELTFIYERTQQRWSKELMELLLAMKERKETALEQKEAAIPQEELTKFEVKYDALLAEGEALNPPEPRTEGKRGRTKRGKALALIDRLKERKANVFLYMRDFRVPFDNNQAERDIRPVKVKQKVSGCMRTHDGADQFAVIHSFTSTMRKNGMSVFEAVQAALAGKALDLLASVGVGCATE
jgi:transposase